MIHISFFGTNSLDAQAMNQVAANSRELENKDFQAFADNNEFDDGIRWDEYGNPYIADITIH